MPSGGKRTGAGRKTMEQSEKRIQITISISRDSKQRLSHLAEMEHTRAGRVLDRLIETEYVNRTK